MRLRHRHRLNYKLVYALVAASLRQYSSIMQRILLVYILYVGAYFILFERRFRARVYRRLRARGTFLLPVRQCAEGIFEWRAGLLLWGWKAAVAGRAGVWDNAVCEAPLGVEDQCASLQRGLLARARLLL
jgi:hypothetical protein